MPSTIPEKPRKLRDTIDAAMSVMGSPCKPFGMSAASRRERTPANSTIASMKPAPAANEFTMA